MAMLCPHITLPPMPCLEKACPVDGLGQSYITSNLVSHIPCPNCWHLFTAFSPPMCTSRSTVQPQFHHSRYLLWGGRDLLLASTCPVGWGFSMTPNRFTCMAGHSSLFNLTLACPVFEANSEALSHPFR